MVNSGGLMTGPTPTASELAGSNANPCPWYDLICQFTPAGQTAVPTTLGNLTGSLGNIASSIGGKSFSGLSGITWGRVGAFVLALILIAAGLFLFRPGAPSITQTVRRGLAI
jgi:hypothetical protein